MAAISLAIDASCINTLPDGLGGSLIKILIFLFHDPGFRIIEWNFNTEPLK